MASEKKEEYLVEDYKFFQKMKKQFDKVEDLGIWKSEIFRENVLLCLKRKQVVILSLRMIQ